MRPTVISLFTGAGGLDLGFEAAGFETRVAVEKDDTAVATLKANRQWPILHGDIHEITSEEILGASSLKEGTADVLIGGPPCQPFSKSGYWATGDSLRLKDARAGTLAAYLRMLRDTLPRVFLLENVPGLLFRGKDEGLQLIWRAVGEINRDRGVNYSLAVERLNAALYGVPQTRERVFIVGSRDGRVFRFPEPTHGDPDRLPRLEPYMTAWDAIGDLEDSEDHPDLKLRGKWADLVPSIPEGENYLWHTDRSGGLPLFKWRSRYWSFLLKLSKRRPCWTLQASPGPATGPFHWKNRRLSGRELARLQTFPDDFVMMGSLAEVQRQIGNAVPAALAEVLGRSIRPRLLDEPDVSLRRTLFPERRVPVPRAERVRPVGKKYLDRIGDHEAHPSTGKGYSAMPGEDDEAARVQRRLPLSA